jgi:GTP cyclohydrolase I
MGAVEPGLKPAIDTARIAAAFTEILAALGEDLSREGIARTPERIAALYADIFSGLNQDPGDLLDISFTENHDELVLVKDIPFYSMCEHHFLPFFGKAHVAYIPKNGKIVGISKLSEVTEAFAHRPQLQERLTTQIADCLYAKLQPFGVMVITEAEHLCMEMRGEQKPGAKIITSAVRGVFEHNATTRAEMLSLISR